MTKKITYYDMISDVIEICKTIGLIIFMIINFKRGGVELDVNSVIQIAQYTTLF